MCDVGLLRELVDGAPPDLVLAPNEPGWSAARCAGPNAESHRLAAGSADLLIDRDR